MNISLSNSHGGQIYSIADQLGITPDNLLDFSSNANIFAEELTKELITATPYPFLHYPDTHSLELRACLAEYENVDIEQIMVGNGAAELIWQMMQGFNPQKILFIGPIFSEYVSACEALKIPYNILTPAPENNFYYTAKELEQLHNTSADLVILCNPNSPAAITYPDISLLLSVLRAPRILIDNSYKEFLYPNPEYVQNNLNAYRAASRPGVAIFTMNSFTKFFCCPGIRLGYLMGDRTHLSRIERIRPAWTVSPYAQKMGVVFLRHIDAYRATLIELSKAIIHMGRELRRLSCILPDSVQEGAGFLCFKLVDPSSVAQVAKALLRQRIIIRNCDNIPGMPAGYIRVQARPAKDADRLIQALTTIQYN